MVLAETCVFGKQLPDPFLCGRRSLTTQGGSRPAAPLIANLRGQFAEFLPDGSLARLGILTLPTCVGFSTVTIDICLEAFLGDLSNHFFRP